MRVKYVLCGIVVIGFSFDVAYVIENLIQLRVNDLLRGGSVANVSYD